jgi:methyl-accepting chemotaxis protein
MKHQRLSSLLIVIFGGLGGIGVAVSGWLVSTAVAEYRTAAWLDQANAVADATIEATGLEGMERGQTAAAIGRPDRVTPDIQQQIQTLRATGDKAFNKAKGLAGTLADRPDHPLKQSLSGLDARYASLQAARADADRLLAGEANAIDAARWAETVTAFIGQLMQVRRDALRPAEDVEQGLYDNVLYREIVSLASENAGRERALLAPIIAANRPIPPELATRLTHYRGVTEDALQRLDLIVSHSPPGSPLRLAVAKVHERYLDHFQHVRAAVYTASAQRQPYPVTPQQWYETATGGINAIQDVAKVISQQTAQVVQTAKARQQRKLIVLAGIIAGVLVVLVLALSIIQRRILRPVTQLVQALDTIGQGDLTCRLQVHYQDEIGDMSAGFNQFLGRLHDTIGRTAQMAVSVAATAQQLSASAEAVTRLTHEVSATIEQSAEGISQEALAVSEAARRTQEMNDVALTVADGARQAALASRDASMAALTGKQAVEKAIHQAHNLHETVSATADTVRSLGVLNEQIGSIVELIKGIASQTNLLALNAAIEAARAGEQGRGFAVVAEEVRKLAAESAASAGRITEMIDGTQRASQQSMQAMASGLEETAACVTTIRQVGDALEQIVGLIQTNDEQVATISTSNQQLAGGLGQVAESMDSIAAMAEESAASTEEVSASTYDQRTAAAEVASAAQDLAGLADDLQRLVQYFRTAAVTAGRSNSNTAGGPLLPWSADTMADDTAKFRTRTG